MGNDQNLSTITLEEALQLFELPKSLGNYEDQDVVYKPEKPLSPTGGVVVLKGNLAENGAIVKVAGMQNDALVFKGSALCFDSEEECFKAVEQKKYKEGDVLIGIKSSGVHSNGFSLVRHILKEKGISLSDKLGNSTVGENLLTPTKIYVKSCLRAIKTGKVKALSHITGGGLVENLPRVLSKGVSANIDYNSWTRPEIFNFFLGKY